jgi:hypothetical protein
MSPATSILGSRQPVSTAQLPCVFLHPVTPSWFRSATSSLTSRVCAYLLAHSLSFIRATWPAHLSVLYFTTLTIFGSLYRSSNSLLRLFRHCTSSHTFCEDFSFRRHSVCLPVFCHHFCNSSGSCGVCKTKLLTLNASHILSRSTLLLTLTITLTRLQTEPPRFDFRHVQEIHLFYNITRGNLVLRQHPVPQVAKFFPRKESGSSVKVPTQSNLVPTLRMGGATPPLPHTPSWRAKWQVLKVKLPTECLVLRDLTCTILCLQTWNLYVQPCSRD